MTTRSLLPRLLAALTALLVVATACAPAAAPQAAAPPAQAPTAAVAAPAPTQTDVVAVMDKTLQALPDGWGNVAPPALNEQLAATRPFLIDVREKSETESAGYIAGAVLIPIRELGKNLDKLPADKNTPIVVYCGSGQRSPMAYLTLRALGYTNVKNLQGGMGAWNQAGLPAVKDTPIPGPTALTPPTAQDPALVAAFDKYFSGLPDGFNLVAPAALNDQLAATKPFLLDVREGSETASGTIQGVALQPIRGLLANVSKLPADKNSPIVVVCGSGHRSSMGMEALKLAGYTNVKSLQGGMGAWTGANLPVSKAGA